MLILDCPICHKTSTNYFVYTHSYIVCSDQCAISISTKCDDVFQRHRNISLPDLVIPKEVCTYCLLDIEIPFIKHNYNFCDQTCYDNWRHKIYGDSEIISY